MRVRSVCSWGSALRSLAMTLGLSGWLMGTTTCPCCGQAMCPVGTAMAGGMGALGGLLTFLWSRRRRERRLLQSDEPPREAVPAFTEQGWVATNVKSP